MIAPIFAAIYRAVLGPCDFTVFLLGNTGTFKTELGALAQQHFGAGFHARNLPADWSGTANANEAIAFAMKDALCVVDDFRPGGSIADRQRMNREAERLIRSQANQSGRARMRADTSLRPPKPPRGLILSTGEDRPIGQSLGARILFNDVAEGDIKIERLTEHQCLGAAGVYAEAMAAYLLWLAPRFDETRGSLKQGRDHYRDLAASSHLHRRTPNIVADLFVGAETFLFFARETGAISEAEFAKYRDQIWGGLGEVAQGQAANQLQIDPVTRFIDLLKSAIASGAAHLAARDGNAPIEATSWGWRERTIGFGDNERTELSLHEDSQGLVV